MTKAKIRVEILSLLNQINEPAERIALIESIGKALRQANSIHSAREVRDFVRIQGLTKNIDYTPILKK